jgi:hypothetical protein
MEKAPASTQGGADALRKAAAQSERSVVKAGAQSNPPDSAEARDRGLIAIWNGQPKRSSVDHDSAHDEA